METQQEQVQEEQHLQSESQVSTQDSPPQDSDKSLDEIIEKEQEEILALDKANEEPEEEGTEVGNAEAEEEGDGEEDDGEYKPNTKYKVLDDELEFDPKLKGLLTKETEPIIRDLYEKASGIEAIKGSRDRATSERDEIRGNYNNLIGEVGRIMNYKRSGDLQSFFEATQLDDQTLAKYLLEKVRISQLPPEQQAVYNEREALRKRMNVLEESFNSVKATGESQELQARMTELDQVIGSEKHNRIAKDFDARNGAGAFKNAVMNHGALQWTISQKDLTPSEAVESFIKMNGISVPQDRPKSAADITKRVVAKPKVKAIPNYGSGQASVTAVRKPKSIEELRKLSREYNS